MAVNTEYQGGNGDSGKGEVFEHATRMVDEAVFVWVVHDVWPNAISSKVRGYVHPKSWYVDFSPVTVT